MKARERRIGPLWVRLSTRTRERRLRTWAGIGPVVDTRGPRRRVVGAAVHAGPLLLVVTWSGPARCIAHIGDRPCARPALDRDTRCTYHRGTDR